MLIYYQSDPKVKGFYSQKNLENMAKYGEYVVNRGEYKSIKND